MKRNLAAIAVLSTSFLSMTFVSMTLVSSPKLAAQSRAVQHTQVVMAGSGRTDLNATLTDLGPRFTGHAK